MGALGAGRVLGATDMVWTYRESAASPDPGIDRCLEQAGRSLHQDAQPLQGCPVELFNALRCPQDAPECLWHTRHTPENTFKGGLAVKYRKYPKIHNLHKLVPLMDVLMTLALEPGHNRNVTPPVRLPVLAR